MTELTVTRPALRYFGAKFRIAPWIIGMLPAHQCYVEPFGGAMGVLLRKPRSRYEVYNDLDGEVVNFWRILRERPDELIRAISLTPYSREEQRLSFEPHHDPLERARRLYLRCWQSHGGGRTQWRSGWRYDLSNTGAHKPVTESWAETAHLWAIVDRIKEVQLEHDEAHAVIKRFDRPTTLFYCDPPYLPDVRSVRWCKKAYQCELTTDDHRALAEALNRIQGMAIISGYASDLYAEIYAGWECRQRPARTDFNNHRVECVWLSPAVTDGQRQRQML